MNTNYYVYCLILVISCGCASVKVDKSPKVDLSTYRSYYVVEQPGSELHMPIVDELQARGYAASSGPRSTMAASDVVVTFTYQWYWDMTMYLLQYEIQFHRPDDEAVLASGKSYRPSLQRKEPRFMAHEILDAMYAKE